MLYLNGAIIGRGPVRGEPEFLGWDEYDLAPALQVGSNVLVALCRYYGRAGPWWIPAEPLGTLGVGSFCFETSTDAELDLVTDERWRAIEAPWMTVTGGNMHAFPPEVIDGRMFPAGLHDPDMEEEEWQSAVVLAGRGHGTVLDRPPAAPYMSPLRRPIPQLASTLTCPQLVGEERLARATFVDDPSETWASVRVEDDGDRRVSVWDAGRACLGHVRLRVKDVAGSGEGGIVDVVTGEDLREDGLPETRPRNWALRYILGLQSEQQAASFDAVGLRYIAAHHPPGLEVEIEVEEIGYLRRPGAAFDCDDERYTELWQIGARTVDVCSTDAFLDCPGREQRAWVADAYPQILVSLVTNPDRRLVRHHLALTARSRFAGGWLAGAAGCDFSRLGLTMPEYSLHWLRSLAAYWLYEGDEPFVKEMLPVADGIIERYERQRGASGLLEDMPGWVFIDWAQVDRDVVTGAHDALYVAALEAYSQLPGAAKVGDLTARTASAFEALWDEDRQIYVDSIGLRGRSRRMSQHTNASALLAGLVPEERVAAVIERMVDPSQGGSGGRLVITSTPADAHITAGDAKNLIPVLQYAAPDDFDPEIDVVAAQPWFCRFLHEALFRHGRRDLIMESLLRWNVQPGYGTFQEFWGAPPGTSSRCHGWSASPTFDITSYFLGLRPLQPGFRRAIVDPYLGPLVRASGRVPTPLGWVSVSIEESNVDIDVPAGIRVDVAGAEVGEGSHHLSLNP